MPGARPGVFTLDLVPCPQEELCAPGLSFVIGGARTRVRGRAVSLFLFVSVPLCISYICILSRMSE